MSRTKIAPTLRNLFADAPDGLQIVEYAPARAELRSLLAVVSAADEVADVLRDCAIFCESCGYENPLDGTDGQERLSRALTHLRSLSSPSKPRKAAKR